MVRKQKKIARGNVATGIIPVTQTLKPKAMEKKPRVSKEISRIIGKFRTAKQLKENSLAAKISYREELKADLRRGFKIVVIDESNSTTRQDKLDSADKIYIRSRIEELNLEIDVLNGEISELNSKIRKLSAQKVSSLKYQRKKLREDRVKESIKNKFQVDIAEVSKNGGRSQILAIQETCKSDKAEAKKSLRAFLGQKLNFSKTSLKKVDEDQELLDYLLSRVEGITLTPAQ